VAWGSNQHSAPHSLLHLPWTGRSTNTRTNDVLILTAEYLLEILRFLAELEARDGAEFKTCSKNGNGKTLLEAVEKRVKVRYRPLGGDKLFAVSVELL
jgi:hypothetical protein